MNNSFQFLASVLLFGMSASETITEELLIEAITSPSNSESLFGLDIDVSGDYIIVGAYKEDVSFTNQYGTYTYKEAGSAYLFKIDTNEATGDIRSYIELGKIDATFGADADDADGDASPYDYFGNAVAISTGYLESHGIVRMVIGAKEGLSFKKGLAFIFEYNVNNGEFSKIAAISPGDASTYSYFGSSVDISESGDFVVVGAWGNNNENGNYAGAAYIFEYDSEDDEWYEDTKLLAYDGVSTDYFGKSVSINDDFAVVSSGSCGGNDAGAAYVFKNEHNEFGEWTMHTKLEASDAGSYDYFGQSVAISNENSNIIVVGADSYDPYTAYFQNNAGGAYMFEYDSDDEWTETAILHASDAAANDLFGYSVDITNDGSFVIIGAMYKDDSVNSLTNSGAAYIFEKDESSDEWNEYLKLVNENAVTNNAFGIDVAIDDDWAIAGKSGSNNNNELYLFDY